MKKIISIFFTFFILFSINYLVVRGKNCPLQTQKPYSIYGQSSVYYITKNCTKRAFSNSKKYFSYFASWDRVNQVSSQQLEQIPKDQLGFMPWGPRKDFRSGVLVKTAVDPKIYVILDNEKCWLKNQKVFNELNYKMDWVVDVSPMLINNLPTCSSPIDYTDHHPPGTLIKYSNSPDVYQIKKHPTEENKLVKDLIKNEQEFNQLGYRWGRIITVSNDEIYPNYSNVADNQENTSIKDTDTETNTIDKDQTEQEKSSGINITHRGDGTYRLSEGELAVADNNVGIRIREITELTDYQQQKFGDDIFWVKVDFYLNDKKLNLIPRRFSGTYRADNSNKMYGLDIGYRYEKGFQKNEEKYVRIILDSLESSISNCLDLVSACRANGRDGKMCKRKYCAVDPTEGEKKFKEGKFIAITPNEIKDIGPEVVGEMKRCYKEVKQYLGYKPIQNRVVTRVYFGRDAAKTSDFGILWPINKTKQKKELDKFRKNTNECSIELMAHEMVHYFARGIPMEDIYHEGSANFIAQQITQSDASDITCKAKGWEGNAAQSHASQIQARCYKSCLSSCYSQITNMELKEGEEKQPGDKFIEFKQVNPKEFWPDTNETGAYHGSMKIIIKDSNKQKIDEKKLFVGNLYHNNGVKVLPDGIAVQKTIYLNKVKKSNFVRFKSFSSKSGTNQYCSSDCTNICQKRRSENIMSYNDLDKYKEVPWVPTYKMFYHSSQCIFQKIDKNNTQSIMKVGKNRRDQAQQMCFGDEIKQVAGEKTYHSLDDIFNIGKACFWKVQRIGNIDCWNESCRKNIGIK